MTIKVFLLLASIAALAHGNSLKVLAGRSTLVSRDCLPGATTCSIQGNTIYCANPGRKCCDAKHNAPVSATCCPGGSYAEPGNYCCTNGDHCQNGKTCLGCTPVGGTPAPPPAVPSLPLTTPAPVSTVAPPPSFTYFTFTIVYYYWQLYYVYVESLARSTVTSSTVRMTTTVSVYATNSAAAQSSFSALSATIALPTPSSATFLPPLPSQTSAVSLATPTSTAQQPTNTSVASSSPSPLQFEGAAGRVVVSKNAYDSLFAWGVAVMVGLVGFGVNFIL